VGTNPGKGTAARRAKGAVRGVLVSLFACVVAVLLLEVVLRTTHLMGARPSWVEPDSTLGWRFTPSRSYWFLKENDHPIEGKINSLGWRDRERTLAKPPGTYRIAVLGDSYVAAFHVELDSTFLAIAERRLTGDLGRKVELMNFGRQGASQAEEYLILQSDALAANPDMVAMLFIPQNDVSDMVKETADGLLRPFFHVSEGGRLVLDTAFVRSREYRWKAIINPLKQRSALVSLLAEQYTAFRKARRQSRISALEDAGGLSEKTDLLRRGPGGTAEKVGGARRKEGTAVNGRRAGIKGYLSLCTSHPDSVSVQGYDLSKAIIGAMAALCKERGIKFLLICSDLATEPEDERRYADLDSSFDSSFFDRDLKQYADSLGVEYLGLQRPFQTAIRDTGRPLHWVHWNYAGHRVAADALVGKLESTSSEIIGNGHS
jgi:hypothetical protein